MKENFGEKHKLPLSFKQMEYYEHRSKKSNKKIIYILKSEKYQSNFYVREKPVKPLTRLL
ncbi:hypothetical protein DRF60_11600 [Chryseobacterium elymi]|uniref:Uncharacterized protein n=1 Tax=Chryseobacterium elymi TaxID=395936 RepID=A0A3D9DI05_9FLAO|nr:hypothetical protein DRF60_11600 [Chryseobacterium elymi]